MPKSSNTPVGKRQIFDSMPPAPQVKIKRPRQVLDEDSYTNALSKIISRDFFPGLLEIEIQQEYLDALESKDIAWISSAGQRLRHINTLKRRGRLAVPQPAANPGRTPTSFFGDTPASVVTTHSIGERLQIEDNMNLSKFQETYTSEDNESFYKLVDKQNQKKADKYAWIWRGNKTPSKQIIAQKAVTHRLAREGKLLDNSFIKCDRLAIKDSDYRPARPDSWKCEAQNGLMFAPKGLQNGVKSMVEASEDASRSGPRTVIYANTRAPKLHAPLRPPSTTLSSIKNAIAGKPREKEMSSSVDRSGGETPRVSGYAFVDDEDNSDDATSAQPAIDLGPGDLSNPFKIQKRGKKDVLHEKMVDRIAQSKRESLRNGYTGRPERIQVPKFPSSPYVSGNFTPAAQRLLNKMGTPKKKTLNGPFGQASQRTPLRGRGSSLRRVEDKHH